MLALVLTGEDPGAVGLPLAWKDLIHEVRDGDRSFVADQLREHVP